MSVCSNCPTPNRRDGLPCGECPVCGSFWMPVWASGGTPTSVGYARISREDYQAWLAANGYGIQPNGRTVLPVLSELPNVTIRYGNPHDFKTGVALA